MATITTGGGIGYEQLRIRIAELERLSVFVGWLESAKYDDGTPVAGVAAVHEFGSPSRGIPPRPFMRNTQAEKKQAWVNIIRNGAQAIMRGQATADQVANLLGLKASGDIRQTISTITEPELKESTIAAKRRKLADTATTGSLDKPLVETGLMINSLTYEVRQ